MPLWLYWIVLGLVAGALAKFLVPGRDPPGCIVTIALGIAAFLVQLVVSYLRREQLRDVTGDPWGARTLEWSTASPPPDYNFAFTPVVHDNDAWHDMKRRGAQRPTSGFKPIHMPKNTAAGIVIAGLSTAYFLARRGVRVVVLGIAQDGGVPLIVGGRGTRRTPRRAGPSDAGRSVRRTG